MIHKAILERYFNYVRLKIHSFITDEASLKKVQLTGLHFKLRPSEDDQLDHCIESVSLIASQNLPLICRYLDVWYKKSTSKTVLIDSNFSLTFLFEVKNYILEYIYLRTLLAVLSDNSQHLPDLHENLIDTLLQGSYTSLAGLVDTYKSLGPASLDQLRCLHALITKLLFTERFYEASTYFTHQMYVYEQESPQLLEPVLHPLINTLKTLQLSLFPSEKLQQSAEFLKDVLDFILRRKRYDETANQLDLMLVSIIFHMARKLTFQVEQACFTAFVDTSFHRDFKKMDSGTRILALAATLCLAEKNRFLAQWKTLLAKILNMFSRDLEINYFRLLFLQKTIWTYAYRVGAEDNVATVSKFKQIAKALFTFNLSSASFIPYKFRAPEAFCDIILFMSEHTPSFCMLELIMPDLATCIVCAFKREIYIHALCQAGVAIMSFLTIMAKTIIVSSPDGKTLLRPTLPADPYSPSSSAYLSRPFAIFVPCNPDSQSSSSSLNSSYMIHPSLNAFSGYIPIIKNQFETLFFKLYYDYFSLIYLIKLEPDQDMPTSAQDFEPGTSSTEIQVLDKLQFLVRCLSLFIDAIPKFFNPDDLKSSFQQQALINSTARLSFINFTKMLDCLILLLYGPILAIREHALNCLLSLITNHPPLALLILRLSINTLYSKTFQKSSSISTLFLNIQISYIQDILDHILPHQNISISLQSLESATASFASKKATGGPTEATVTDKANDKQDPALNPLLLNNSHTAPLFKISLCELIDTVSYFETKVYLLLMVILPKSKIMILGLLYHIRSLVYLNKKFSKEPFSQAAQEAFASYIPLYTLFIYAFKAFDHDQKSILGPFTSPASVTTTLFTMTSLKFCTSPQLLLLENVPSEHSYSSILDGKAIVRTKSPTYQALFLDKKPDLPLGFNKRLVKSKSHDTKNWHVFLTIVTRLILPSKTPIEISLFLPHVIETFTRISCHLEKSFNLGPLIHALRKIDLKPPTKTALLSHLKQTSFYARHNTPTGDSLFKEFIKSGQSKLQGEDNEAVSCYFYASETEEPFNRFNQLLSDMRFDNPFNETHMYSKSSSNRRSPLFSITNPPPNMSSSVDGGSLNIQNTGFNPQESSLFKRNGLALNVFIPAETKASTKALAKSSQKDIHKASKNKGHFSSISQAADHITKPSLDSSNKNPQKINMVMHAWTNLLVIILRSIDDQYFNTSSSSSISTPNLDKMATPSILLKAIFEFFWIGNNKISNTIINILSTFSSSSGHLALAFAMEAHISIYTNSRLALSLSNLNKDHFLGSLMKLFILLQKNYPRLDPGIETFALFPLSVPATPSGLVATSFTPTIFLEIIRYKYISPATKDKKIFYDINELRFQYHFAIYFHNFLIYKKTIDPKLLYHLAILCFVFYNSLCYIGNSASVFVPLSFLSSKRTGFSCDFFSNLASFRDELTNASKASTPADSDYSDAPLIQKNWERLVRQDYASSYAQLSSTASSFMQSFTKVDKDDPNENFVHPERSLFLAKYKYALLKAIHLSFQFSEENPTLAMLSTTASRSEKELKDQVIEDGGAYSNNQNTNPILLRSLSSNDIFDFLFMVLSEDHQDLLHTGTALLDDIIALKKNNASFLNNLLACVYYSKSVISKGVLISLSNPLLCKNHHHHNNNTGTLSLTQLLFVSLVKLSDNVHSTRLVAYQLLRNLTRTHFKSRDIEQFFKEIDDYTRLDFVFASKQAYIVQLFSTAFSGLPIEMLREFCFQTLNLCNPTLLLSRCAAHAYFFMSKKIKLKPLFKTVLPWLDHIILNPETLNAFPDLFIHLFGLTASFIDTYENLIENLWNKLCHCKVNTDAFISFILSNPSSIIHSKSNTHLLRKILAHVFKNDPSTIFHLLVQHLRCPTPSRTHASSPLRLDTRASLVRPPISRSNSNSLLNSAVIETKSLYMVYQNLYPKVEYPFIDIFPLIGRTPGPLNAHKKTSSAFHGLDENNNDNDQHHLKRECSQKDIFSRNLLAILLITDTLNYINKTKDFYFNIIHCFQAIFMSIGKLNSDLEKYTLVLLIKVLRGVIGHELNFIHMLEYLGLNPVSCIKALDSNRVNLTSIDLSFFERIDLNLELFAERLVSILAINNNFIININELDLMDAPLKFDPNLKFPLQSSFWYIWRLISVHWTLSSPIFPLDMQTKSLRLTYFFLKQNKPAAPYFFLAFTFNLAAKLGMFWDLQQRLDPHSINYILVNQSQDILLTLFNDNLLILITSSIARDDLGTLPELLILLLAHCKLSSQGSASEQSFKMLDFFIKCSTKTHLLSTSETIKALFAETDFGYYAGLHNYLRPLVTSQEAYCSLIDTSIYLYQQIPHNFQNAAPCPDLFFLILGPTYGTSSRGESLTLYTIELLVYMLPLSVLLFKGSATTDLKKTHQHHHQQQTGAAVDRVHKESLLRKCFFAIIAKLKALSITGNISKLLMAYFSDYYAKGVKEWLAQLCRAIREEVRPSILFVRQLLASLNDLFNAKLFLEETAIVSVSVYQNMALGIRNADSTVMAALSEPLPTITDYIRTILQKKKPDTSLELLKDMLKDLLSTEDFSKKTMLPDEDLCNEIDFNFKAMGCMGRASTPFTLQPPASTIRRLKNEAPVEKKDFQMKLEDATQANTNPQLHFSSTLSTSSLDVPNFKRLPHMLRVYYHAMILIETKISLLHPDHQLYENLEIKEFVLFLRKSIEKATFASEEHGASSQTQETPNFYPSYSNFSQVYTVDEEAAEIHSCDVADMSIHPQEQEEGTLYLPTKPIIETAVDTNVNLGILAKLDSNKDAKEPSITELSANFFDDGVEVAIDDSKPLPKALDDLDDYLNAFTQDLDTHFAI